MTFTEVKYGVQNNWLACQSTGTMSVGLTENLIGEFKEFKLRLLYLDKNKTKFKNYPRLLS
jgi:hypothetical protein